MFSKVLSKYFPAHKNLSKWQSKMDSFYAESQRYYHNMYHIGAF